MIYMVKGWNLTMKIFCELVGDVMDCHNIEHPEKYDPLFRVHPDASDSSAPKVLLRALMFGSVDRLSRWRYI